MNTFKNKYGKPILLSIVKAIQDNKAYLGEVDGLIGDGDHGMNMNKGFTVFERRIADRDISFTEGLEELGNILMTEIGGSMGPIYGTIFISMAEAGVGLDDIGAKDLEKMLVSGLEGLQEIVEAKVGDKTLVDTLSPAAESVKSDVASGKDFEAVLNNMKSAAEKGKDSTKDMVAKFGRSSRLGERSRGVLDAGATSCCIILTAVADGILEVLL
jgi:dihydroxyacetone kinase-like protein